MSTFNNSSSDFKVKSFNQGFQQSHDNGRFNNFNLNKNHHCFKTVETLQGEGIQNGKARNSWKFESGNICTSSKGLNVASIKATQISKSFNFWGTDNAEDEKKKKDELKLNQRNSSKNSSTLSLHIAAYENSVESSIESSVENSLKVKEQEFKYPRGGGDGDNSKSQELEMMQFKTSQKLFNPNISQTESGEGTSKGLAGFISEKIKEHPAFEALNIEKTSSSNKKSYQRPATIKVAQRSCIPSPHDIYLFIARYETRQQSLLIPDTPGLLKSEIVRLGGSGARSIYNFFILYEGSHNVCLDLTERGLLIQSGRGNVCLGLTTMMLLTIDKTLKTKFCVERHKQCHPSIIRHFGGIIILRQLYVSVQEATFIQREFMGSAVAAAGQIMFMKGSGGFFEC